MANVLFDIQSIVIQYDETNPSGGCSGEVGLWAAVDNLRGREHGPAYANLFSSELEQVHRFCGIGSCLDGRVFDKTVTFVHPRHVIFYQYGFFDVSKGRKYCSEIVLLGFMKLDFNYGFCTL